MACVENDTRVALLLMFQTRVCGVLERPTDNSHNGGELIDSPVNHGANSVVVAKAADIINTAACEQRVNSSTDSLTNTSQSILISIHNRSTSVTLLQSPE